MQEIEIIYLLESIFSSFPVSTSLVHFNWLCDEENDCFVSLR